jgi:hypothetical protein
MCSPSWVARVRLLATGATNKNDPNDARSVAVAALRSTAPREVAAEDRRAAPPRSGRSAAAARVLRNSSGPRGRPGLNSGSSCVALSLGVASSCASLRGFGRMGEDNRVPPLPRRVRGETGMPGAAARVAPVLSESSLQRIRAAFYGEPERIAGQEQAAYSQRPAPLPRRVPGANDGPRPLRVARPELRASLPEPGPGAVTAPPPVTSPSASSEIVSQAVGMTGAERDRAAEPETDHRPPATMRAPAGQRARRRAGGRKALASRGFRSAGVFALVMLITAGSLAFALSRHTAAAARGGYGLAAEGATRNLAAAWVADRNLSAHQTDLAVRGAARGRSCSREPGGVWQWPGPRRCQSLLPRGPESGTPAVLPPRTEPRNTANWIAYETRRTFPVTPAQRRPRVGAVWKRNPY